MNRRISSSIPNLVALAQNLPSTLTFSESRHHTHSSQQRTGWTENLRTQLSGTSTLRRPLFKPWGRRGGLPPPTMRGVPDWVTLCTNASVSVQRQRIGAERGGENKILGSRSAPSRTRNVAAQHIMEKTRRPRGSSRRLETPSATAP